MELGRSGVVFLLSGGSEERDIWVADRVLATAQAASDIGRAGAFNRPTHQRSGIETRPSRPLPAGAPEVSGPLGAETLATLRAGLRLMALRALGDADAAEEAAQETLGRALAALADGRAPEIHNLGAFVHGIARHVIADVRRARWRLVGADALANQPDPASTEDALGRAVAAEERERVRAALRRLSSGDREILHLSFYEGLTPAEVADRLGEPPLRVRKRKSRALERLRRVFLGAAPGHDAMASPTNSGEQDGAPAAKRGEQP
jgi:RNA polymerase sigma factor (sigma-70 family)